MVSIDVVEASREIFSDAWKLYVKYLDGPQNNADTYWHNMAVEGGALTDKWPCALAHDLVKAVLEEHSRRERRKEMENK